MHIIKHVSSNVNMPGLAAQQLINLGAFIGLINLNLLQFVESEQRLIEERW